MKNRFTILTSLLFYGFVLISYADRSNPAPVEPVELNGVKYKAPTYDPVSGYTVGFVEARDSANKRLIWSRQIYVVKYDTNMETDVQDVYITRLVLDNNLLRIYTERGYEYELDLATLEVRPIKGNLIVTEL